MRGQWSMTTASNERVLPPPLTAPHSRLRGSFPDGALIQGKQLEAMKEAYSLAIEYGEGASDAASVSESVPAIAAASSSSSSSSPFPPAPPTTAAAAAAAAPPDVELTLEEVCTGRTPPPLPRPPLPAAAAAARLQHSRQVSGIYGAETNDVGNSAAAAVVVEENEPLSSSSGIRANQVGGETWRGGGGGGGGGG